MGQQKYTQAQQVIDTLRKTGGYATLGDLYHLVDTKSWATKTPNESIYQSEKRDFVLAHGDCFKLLKEFDFKFDMIKVIIPILSYIHGIHIGNKV